jgi:hypothetical protein
MGIGTGSKFYHSDIINIINKEFPLLLEGNISEKYEFKGHITIKKLSDPYITGIGSKDNEKKISENVIKINGQKDVLISYMEDSASAELTIKIGGKPVGSIKKMERLTAELLTALVKAVDENIKGGK